jgi:poly-gamma-glutamate capsule biosynthesis protein CapA/YwtB (metallophosphatase superfamily)
MKTRSRPLINAVNLLISATYFLTFSAYAAELTPTLRFENACTPATSTLTLAAVGDFLMHSPLQRQAEALKTQGGFASLWRDVQPWLDQADLRYGNLEGPISKSRPASSYPQFNYSEELANALVSSRFDVVSTANNHALDQGGRGVDETIAELRERHLPFTGTRLSSDTRNELWSTVVEARGFRLAFIACTFSTNGITDRYHQVLDCYRDEPTLMRRIRELSNEPSVDAVFVTPHWGVEYRNTPETRERGLARRMLEAGALAVVGAHPHVLQPMEKHIIGGKERFIIYSLGNFVSGQVGTERRTSTLLFLKLSRLRNGQVTLAGAKGLPLYMAQLNGIIGVHPAAEVKTEYGRAAERIHRTVLGSRNELNASESVLSAFARDCYPDH